MKTYKIVTNLGGPAITVKADRFDRNGGFFYFMNSPKKGSPLAVEDVSVINEHYVVSISIE